MGTAIVLVVLAVVVALATKSLIKDKKNGKSISFVSISNFFSLFCFLRRSMAAIDETIKVTANTVMDAINEMFKTPKRPATSGLFGVGDLQSIT